MPLESGLLLDDVDCTQQDFEGEVRVSPSGGTAPYTISWNGGDAELLDIAPDVACTGN